MASLTERSTSIIKKINDCVNTKNAKKIKTFWLDNQEVMNDLLNDLKNANKKKEYEATEHAIKHVLFKTVLINKSKRLMRDIEKAVAKVAEQLEVDHSQVIKFRKRSHHIERDMKGMGFDREAKMHAALYHLHISDLRNEIEVRVLKDKDERGLLRK